MNKKQKKVILICTVLILLMAVFPPQMYTGGGQFGNSQYSEGYAFFFTLEYAIDSSRLMMQWVTVILVGIGLGLYLKDD